MPIHTTSTTGRRVIAAYFMLFLHSSCRLKPTDDVEDIAAKSLNTHLIGEYVGNEWGVGRELVWAPSISEQLKSEGYFPGLHKVQGETVQAIMGAIYHQFVRFLFLRRSFCSSCAFLGRRCDAPRFPHEIPAPPSRQRWNTESVPQRGYTAL